MSKRRSIGMSLFRAMGVMRWFIVAAATGGVSAILLLAFASEGRSGPDMVPLGAETRLVELAVSAVTIGVLFICLHVRPRLLRQFSPQPPQKRFDEPYDY